MDRIVVVISWPTGQHDLIVDQAPHFGPDTSGFTRINQTHTRFLLFLQWDLSVMD